MISLKRAIYKILDEVLKPKGGNEPKRVKSQEEQYKEIDERFDRVFKMTHCFGFACYVIMSIVIAIRLFSFWKDKGFQNTIILILFGAVFGILWNVYGYFSDLRIDWSKIFDKLNDFKIAEHEEICSEKYKYYKRSLVSQLVIIAVIILTACIIALNVNGNIFDNTSNNTSNAIELLSYSSIVGLFITVVSVYLKQTSSLFFKLKRKDKNDETDIFPNIYDLIGKTNE